MGDKNLQVEPITRAARTKKRLELQDEIDNAPPLELGSEEDLENELITENSAQLEISLQEDEAELEQSEFEEVEPEKTFQDIPVSHVIPKKNRHKKHVSYAFRTARGLILALIFTTIAGILFFSSKAIKTTTTLFYKEQSDLDYKVYLKPNDFYTEPYLGKDKKYVASLIDKIEIDFSYNYALNEAADFEYRYWVDGMVLVYDKTTPEKAIFEKKVEVLTAESEQAKSTKTFAIAPKVSIKYDEYNDLVKLFTNEFSLNAESKLKLTLIVEVAAKNNNLSKAVPTTNRMELDIPLTEKTVDVTMNYEQINNSDIIKETSTAKPINYILLGLAISAAGIASIFIVLTISFLLLLGAKTQNVYQKKIKKILNTYDRVIVKLKRPVEITDEDRVMDVETFEDLLDTSDRLELPILYNEIHKSKCWFIVRNGNEVYRCVIKEVDLENHKK